jgi:hypothetical protein
MPRHVSCLDLCGVSRRPRGEVGSSPPAASVVMEGRLFAFLSGVIPITQEVPCRFIPLNDLGETVDSLYRTGTQQEMEETLCEWLHREIRRLEAERTELHTA